MTDEEFKEFVGDTIWGQLCEHSVDFLKQNPDMLTHLVMDWGHFEFLNNILSEENRRESASEFNYYLQMFQQYFDLTPKK